MSLGGRERERERFFCIVVNCFTMDALAHWTGILALLTLPNFWGIWGAFLGLCWGFGEPFFGFRVGNNGFLT